MCGIFAYKGKKTNGAELVIEGLKKLEYRGYDSWGVAYQSDNKLNFHTFLLIIIMEFLCFLSV